MEKVSNITVEKIANYLRLTEISFQEEEELNLYLKIAKNYIENYTGIPQESDDEEAETLDSYSDFIIVVYILCQDMYDTRSLYVDKTNLNRVVESILGMHSLNNIC